MAAYIAFKGTNGLWHGPSRISGPHQKERVIYHVSKLIDQMHEVGACDLVNSIKVAIDPHEIDPNYEENIKAKGYEIVDDKLRFKNNQGSAPLPPQLIEEVQTND